MARLPGVPLRVVGSHNLSLRGSVSGMQTELGASIPINGHEVRRARLLGRHLGAIALASEVQISRQYLWQIETGKRTHVSPDVFGRLKAALETETEVLLAKRPESVPA